MFVTEMDYQETMLDEYSEQEVLLLERVRLSDRQVDSATLFHLYEMMDLYGSDQYSGARFGY